jgi:hypothetical protein
VPGVKVGLRDRWSALPRGVFGRRSSAVSVLPGTAVHSDINYMPRVEVRDAGYLNMRAARGVVLLLVLFIERAAGFRIVPAANAQKSSVTAMSSSRSADTARAGEHGLGRYCKKGQACLGKVDTISCGLNLTVCVRCLCTHSLAHAVSLQAHICCRLSGKCPRRPRPSCA